MRRYRPTARTALATVALAFLVVATDRDAAGVVAAGAGRAATPAAGAKVFASSGCAACHTFTPAGAAGKVGPNLDNLSLAAGATALVITTGRNAMPSFKGRLSATQISDVAAYLLAAKAPASKPAPAKPVKGAKGTLTVRLTDTKLALSAAVLQPGRVTLHARNTGKRRHTLVVLRTEPSPRLVTAFRRIRPGQALTRVLKLATGSYLVSSDRRGQIHGSMLALLRVRATVSVTTPKPGPGTTPATGGGTAGGAGSAAATNGSRLFASLGCGGCHTFEPAGSKGTVGPNLSATRPTSSRVVAIVTSGSGVMPSFASRASAQEIRDVAAFITSAGGGGAVAPATGPPGLLLFQRGGCGGCHTLAAAGATGTKGPDLDHEHPDADKVVKTVTRGKDSMPSFVTVFSAAEIRELANWVASVVRGGGDSDDDD